MDRWQRVEELCHAALELAEDEQEAYLKGACGGDDELLREVQSLLVHQKQADGFIETPAVEIAAKALARDGLEQGSRLGQLVSHYRIVERLGHGGMGDVYRAVRADDQYRKQVALKVVAAGLGSPLVLERFERERQILADLEHPNVARLIDGGTTEDGGPYFVMELVEGKPLDQFCDANRLGIRERLSLFRNICAAVQYAHQHLVVHRDLKPSNILVTAEGVPKLLDFGIAKVLEPLPRVGERTVTAVRMLTPEYASPEQLRGERITTASDVYSLGVLLYYVLAGHLPYRLTTRSLREITEAICETEPEAPSAAVSRIEDVVDADGRVGKVTPDLVSSARGDSIDKLRRRLTGDLDQIVLKAMRKEVDQRYSTVEQLSDDIHHYLEGRPVRARKPTLGYRVSRFVRRHRVPVIAAASAVLAVIGGVAGTVRQSRIARAQRLRAERRFQDVRDLANALMFDINDSLVNVTGATAARELLVTKALKYLDGLAAEAGDDPSLERELATAYQRVGDIQGYLSGAQNLGHTSEAMESYRKAVGIREALAVAQPTDRGVKRDLATTYRRLGEVSLLQNDFKGASENDRKALSILEALSAAATQDVEVSRELGAAYYSAGRHLSVNGDWNGAVQYEMKALSLFEALSRAAPADTQISLNLAAACRQACYNLNQTGDRPRALELCRRAVDVNEGIAKARPNDVRAHLDLSAGYGDLGDVLSDQGDLTSALRCWREALSLSEAVAEKDPKDARGQVNLALAHNRLGWLLAKASKTDGLSDVRRALEIRKKLYAADPKNKGRLEAIAVSFGTLGDVEEMLASGPSLTESQIKGHWREARSWYKQAFATFGQLRAEGALRGGDADEPDRLTREIAKCEARLATPRDPVPSQGSKQ